MPTVKPKISLGMPVYNGEKYIAHAIDSILAQTYPNFELIITDNASTDRTQEIVATYMQKDGRIRYYRNQTNLGAAGNFNYVFTLARGDYFKWAAYDDLLAPEFLEKCLEIMEKEAAVSLCYPASLLVDAQGDVKGEYRDELHLRQAKAHERLQEFFARPGLCHAVFGLTRTAQMKNSALIGNFPRSDRNLIGQLVLKGQVHELPDKLFLRRIHPKTSTAVNITEYELAVWFDPKKKGKLVFPRIRRLVEYIKAIQRANLTRTETVRCYLLLVNFLAVKEKWAGIIDDIASAFKLRRRVS